MSGEIEMKLLIIILLFMLSGCANNWTHKDTVRQLAVTAVLAADAYTSAKIQYAPGVYEGGPLARHLLVTSSAISQVPVTPISTLEH